MAGRCSSADVVRAFSQARLLDREYPRWLDFGCGSGRVARHILGTSVVSSLVGVDIDDTAIRWISGRLARAKFLAIDPSPPLSFPDGSFDVIYAVSVFTHLDESSATSWFHELTRALAPEGLLILTTLSPVLTFERADLVASDHARLASKGFLLARGGGPFNEDTAFATQPWLCRTMTGRLSFVSFEQHGLCRYQDLSVWRKPADEAPR